MSDVKLFIGSSAASAGAARLIAEYLEKQHCADVRVWDEGVFTLNQGVLERLLNVVDDYDFAVMIWGPDDVTESKGESAASPRDNVIFECGLFMGRLGRDRVFVVCDESAQVKVPSDFAGITLAHYRASRIETDGESAVRAACLAIADAIKRAGRPEFTGEWRSRFAMMADPDHREVFDDLSITAARDGIMINSLASKVEPYSAYGRIVGNQIIGEWRHKTGENFVDGTFMLVVNPRATVMYGYCTGKDENGGMIFAKWVLAKKTNLGEAEITKLLDWGRQALKDHTMTPVS